MAEIKENFHKEKISPEGNPLPLEQIRRKNEFHHLFDQAQREGSLEKIDDLQKEYIEQFGFEQSQDSEMTNIKKVEFTKDNVNLLNEYLDSLTGKERQEWLGIFQKLPNRGGIEGILVGYKPACFLRKDEADFILSIPGIEKILQRSPANVEGFCFLYNVESVADIIKNNYDAFSDLFISPDDASNLEKINSFLNQQDPRSPDYFTCLRIGIMMGYYRADVDMYARYENMFNIWREKKVDQENKDFSSRERLWFKLFYSLASNQEKDCLSAVDDILDNVFWLENITGVQKSEITDIFCNIKEAIRKKTFKNNYLEFAHALQPIIYKKILEHKKMSPFLKSYFLSRRHLDINGIGYFSYGYNEAHKAIAAKAEKLLRESGLKNFIEQKPLARQ